MLTVFIWALFGWGANAILLSALGEHRYKGLKLLAFWSVVVLVNAVVTVLLYGILPFERFASLSVIVAMVLELVPYVCTTRGPMGKRCFFAFNATFAVAFMSTLAIHFFTSLTIQSTAIRAIFCALLAFLYRRFVHRKLEIAVANLTHQWLWLNGIGVLFSALFYFYLIRFGIGSLPFYQMLPVMALMLVVYIGLFYTLYYMSAAITLSQNQLQEETLLGQVKRLMDIEEQARIMRHDLRHHNQAITSFVQQGQFTELLAYLAEYDHSLLAESRPHYCNHPLVNNILGVYHGKSELAGIDFQPQASLSADCSIGQRDLLGVLSNLLENALHGCPRGGTITMRLFEKDRKFVVICENTAPVPILFQEGIPQAKDRNSSGIASILRTVTRYDGLADFRQCQDVFTAHIILNLE